MEHHLKGEAYFISHSLAPACYYSKHDVPESPHHSVCLRRPKHIELLTTVPKREPDNVVCIAHISWKSVSPRHRGHWARFWQIFDTRKRRASPKPLQTPCSELPVPLPLLKSQVSPNAHPTEVGSTGRSASNSVANLGGIWLHPRKKTGLHLNLNVLFTLGSWRVPKVGPGLAVRAWRFRNSGNR